MTIENFWHYYKIFLDVFISLSIGVFALLGFLIALAYVINFLKEFFKGDL